MIKRKIDIKGGELTFGQRIEIGKILVEKDLEDFDRFRQTYKCLYKKEPSLTITSARDAASEFEEIIEGIVFWIKKEAELLKYEPSPEEQRAGIIGLAAKIGEFGTVKAIAKTYGQDPDEILKWKYGKVFAILYTDLEEHKFQIKLQKIHTDAAKRKYSKDSK
jgi:hypothetical protein